MEYFGIILMALFVVGIVAAIHAFNENSGKPAVTVADLEANPAILKFSIAGINYRKGISRYVGRFNAQLVPEPENEYDANAIAIHHSDGHLLGYIPSGETMSLHSLLAGKFPYPCVGEIQDAGDHFFGYIFLVKPE